MSETYTARQTTGGISHVDLDDRALDYALSKISWPATKHRLLNWVKANDQRAELGTILSQQDAWEETGISRTLARKYFAELVDELVLDRYPGAGPRGHAYAINRAFDEWRVPWFGAHPAIDRDWPAKRERAIAQILLFVCPPEGSKTRLAARPVARLTATAARSGALLWSSSRAPTRAAGADLAARPVARLGNASNGADTIPSNSETHSLTERGSKNGAIVLATITDRAGSPVFGKLATRVRQLVGDDDPADVVGAIHRAPPGLAITAYVEIVDQAVARRGLDPLEAPAAPRPENAEWKPETDEPAAPPPWLGASGREWLAANGARECETANGGAQ